MYYSSKIVFVISFSLIRLVIVYFSVCNYSHTSSLNCKKESI
jgi:hypothetical protein